MIDVNWCGFYFLKGEELVLGPYQGKPACTRIALGKGVCGTAAEQHRSIIVEEVSLFPGHISCDGASRSEIVIPMLWDDELLGVLDIDSPISSRFDSTDKKYLERIVHSILMESASTFFEETD
jgi:GAF domain-containing protein